MKIGYACLNMTLASQNIFVNRSMMKKTFLTKGITFASELALKNIKDLDKVIFWNIAQGISFYRLSSDMFPWMSEYELPDLPDIAAIREVLARVGQRAMAACQRLTFHPGPFNVLATSNQSVLARTVKELRQHGEIMDMLGLPLSPYAKINIHIGGAYGDKCTAMERFCDNFLALPPPAARRLTVENDDKANMFSVADLIHVHRKTGIPVVFDFLHHKFCTGNLTETEAFLLAVETWPKDIVPIVHFSSSKKEFEDRTAPGAAHADFVYEPIPVYGKKVDIMLEAKAKERAVQKFADEYLREKQWITSS
jgi:UV DNA damage endonuclease